MSRKSDKRCAQIAVAAAMAAPTAADTRFLVKETLTPNEMVRAVAYIQSGKPIRGRA
ncbi:hypothetical protein OOK39_46060 [Streptomyces sp. NBC_00264]|uniref:hypothetical protein n=1 Tax=unclassified Streptomyces TaxID=2593676 RepID=UPI00225AC199|nr:MULTISPECIES: hypothetical protein [unclassified Streptomyces]MCX5166383.1 hypothetical protein [Streptomyces sp. NBC_00305]MCX5166404.1 hypothetical protein [Streptomyces sp. NBC_00305]MCX5224901.1 hypothetical protein [Streptomyces sp. NBC_00264]